MKSMLTKIFIALRFYALTILAQALEVKGVKVDESAQVGVNTLVLNGVGELNKIMFKA